MSHSKLTKPNRYACRLVLTMMCSLLLASFVAPSKLFAQQQGVVTPQEYIRSTSPLSSGGNVTRLSAQGQNVQTVTTIAQLPSTSSLRPQVPTGFVQRNNNEQSNANAQAAYPYPAQLRAGQSGSVARSNSVMTRDGAIASTASTLNGNTLQTGNMQNANGRQAVSSQFLKAQAAAAQNVNQRVASAVRTPNYQAFRQSAFQVPASGTVGQNYLAQANQAAVQAANQTPSLVGRVNNRLRVAQNCNCLPAPNAAYQAPALNANTVPNLNIQMPGQAAPQLGYQQGYQQGYPQGYQQGYQLQPTLGTPQFGAQGARWWTPFVTGSGAYPPLVRLQNLPPGTYLGQGIIGQPTAYVDGQWLRNLFRYIAP